jgi:hypothetical protein
MDSPATIMEAPMMTLPMATTAKVAIAIVNGVPFT